MTIDVIIPLYKPGQELIELVEMLEKQSIPVHQIILMNTEEKYFNNLIYGTRFLEKYQNVQVFHVSKREFDHGKTRNLGVAKSQADYFVMMTQDALPTDEFLLERLIAGFTDQVACAYARQVVTDETTLLEKFTRQFNYPPQDALKTSKDIERLGIKAFFCSNVCCCYRRDVFDKLGGFCDHTIFNEDMIYAAGALKAGYEIAYVSKATVFHSHKYSAMQQFRRNFDLGVSQADHPEIFKGVSSESEGKKLVKAVTIHLKKQHLMRKLFGFYFQCGCKYVGYILGKHYFILPKGIILKITTNKEYWF